MSEPSNEVKAQIVRQEIVVYENTRYQFQLRHRVQQALGNEDLCKTIVLELEKIERGIDLLEAEVTALGKVAGEG